MTKLDEREIIRIFQNRFGKNNRAAEDVEVFKINGKNVVVKIDTLVESTDIPRKARIEYFIRKSIVSCVSDFAAKGVKPRFGIVSLTIPKQFSKQYIQKIASSMGKAVKEFDFEMLGGDTNEGKELVIRVSLFGSEENIVFRKGAKIGEFIFVTGPFGYTSAGLKIIQEKSKTSPKFAKKAKNAFLKPTPKLKFALKNKKFFSSSMDSSDGLSTTLNEMSKQSKKKFVITKLPAGDDLFEFAKKNELDPLDLIFNGGEEYEIVFTISQENRKKIIRNAKLCNVPLMEIGYVAKGENVFVEFNRCDSYASNNC